MAFTKKILRFTFDLAGALACFRPGADVTVTDSKIAESGAETSRK